MISACLATFGFISVFPQFVNQCLSGNSHILPFYICLQFYFMLNRLDYRLYNLLLFNLSLQPQVTDDTMRLVHLSSSRQQQWCGENFYHWCLLIIIFYRFAYNISLKWLLCTLYLWMMCSRFSISSQNLMHIGESDILKHWRCSFVNM